MTNLEVSWILNEIADILEINGENEYKVRAYRRAANSVKKVKEDLKKLYYDKKLKEISGVGESISEIISEIILTGKSTLLEELLKKIPESLLELRRVPGIGPKTINLLHKSLNITTLEELEEAARAKKIRKLPRMGNKTEMRILRGIKFLKKEAGMIPAGIALPVAQAFKEELKNLPCVKEIEIAGSLRRGKDMVQNIDLVVATDQPELVIDIFKKMPEVKKVLLDGVTRSTIVTWTGIKVNLRISSKEDYALALNYFTGSKKHNIKLQEHAKKIGIDLNHLGMFLTNEVYMLSSNNREKLAIYSEEDIYKTLQMEYIPPELREGRDEIELALNKKIPKLIERKDLRGDLHIHTNWTDGNCKIEDAVEEALKMGYEYIAITDHSKFLKVAGGLTEKKLMEQMELINEINKNSPIKIFCGCEVDILKDGTLDFPDSILEKLDIVIASVHSNMHLDKKEMTKRIVKAIQNPHIDILAHPTGRVLGRRAPYELDISEILKAAQDTNTALEINSTPDRLDLKDEHAAMAKEMGIKVVINTDSHDVNHFENITYGIKVAKRAGLEPNDVINTLTLKEITKWLKLKKG